jgi:hypothetical protein
MFYFQPARRGAVDRGEYLEVAGAVDNGRHVRFVPKADICSAANSSLFNHLVGTAEQRERESDA